MRIVRPLAIAAFLLLLGASPASATIYIDRAIGPVKLGMTSREVRARLGPPDAIYRVPNGNRVYHTRFVYRAARLQIDISSSDRGREVKRVRTRNPKERTRLGIGVGSRTEDVTSVYPKASCRVNGDGDGRCAVWRGGSGGATWFVLADKRVAEVRVFHEYLVYI